MKQAFYKLPTIFRQLTNCLIWQIDANIYIHVFTGQQIDLLFHRNNSHCDTNLAQMLPTSICLFHRLQEVHMVGFKKVTISTWNSMVGDRVASTGPLNFPILSSPFNFVYNLPGTIYSMFAYYMRTVKSNFRNLIHNIYFPGLYKCNYWSFHCLTSFK